MEEDIEFIKYYMKQYFYEDISIEDDFKFEKAIKNLLTRYKQLEEENKQLKVNEEILLKTKGCINEDNSTNCRVLESLNYGIRTYEKTLEKLQKETIWKSKVKEKIEELKKQRKQLMYKTYLRREDMLNDDREIASEIAVLEELIKEN